MALVEYVEGRLDTEDRVGRMLYRNGQGNIVWFPIPRETVELRWEMGLSDEWVFAVKYRMATIGLEG